MSDDYENQQQWAAYVEELDRQARDRYDTDCWSKSIGAIKRHIPPNMGATVIYNASQQTSDPVERLMRAGMECLADEASAGNADSERQYHQIRERQRQEHRKARGRTW